MSVSEERAQREKRGQTLSSLSLVSSNSGLLSIPPATICCKSCFSKSVTNNEYHEEYYNNNFVLIVTRRMV